MDWGTRASNWWKDLPLREKSHIVVALPLLSLLVNSLFIYIRHQVEADAEYWVTHTLDVQLELESLPSEISGAQRSAKLYALTFKREALQAYLEGVDQVQKSLDRAQNLMADNPGQVKKLKIVRRIVEERISLIARYAESRSRQTIEDPVLANLSSRQMEALSRQLHEMQAEERRLQNIRQRKLESVRRSDYLVMAGTLLFGLLGGMLSIRLLVSGILRRTQDLQLSVALLAEGREWCLAEPANDEIGHVAQGLARTGELLNHRAAEMREANAKLEEALRRQKQTEDLLLDAKRRAEEGSLAKSQFLACMSHEIRTPMNSICGMADLLLETPLNEEQREYVKIFRASSDRLLNLINDILDLSKVESGKLELEAAPFDLEQAIERATELIAPQAHRKGLELAAEIAPDVPSSLLGDSERLQQILLNLLGNSVKFTSSGEVVLRVEREPGSAEGTLRFSVSDTGPGLNEEQKHRLFESFVQADSSITRRFGGTGLGLAITKGLVELMGGRIAVESRPGKGSTFSFVVPFEAGASKRGPDVDRGPISAGLMALIVDDNATTRMILRKALQRWGIEADEAESGGKALRLLQAAIEDRMPYSLLLLDRQMPGMDGLELARRVREKRELKDLPTLILASDREAGDLEQARSLRVQILSKPVKPLRLLEAIREAVDQHREAPIASEARIVDRAEAPLEQRRNILLVDDSEHNLFLVQAFLKHLPYDVATATNGLRALELACASNFDLILMDVQMPEMDGYTATLKIREAERERGSKPTPIVALTANALNGEAERSREAGCTAYLSKPVRKSALLETMQTLFVAN